MDTTTNVEALVNQGINELKAGRKNEARQFLLNAVRTNPKSERAWLYLSATLPPDKAVEALQRVLLINPHNKQALHAIETLHNKAASVTATNGNGTTSVPPLNYSPEAYDENEQEATSIFGSEPPTRQYSRPDFSEGGNGYVNPFRQEAEDENLTEAPIYSPYEANPNERYAPPSFNLEDRPRFSSEQQLSAFDENEQTDVNPFTNPASENGDGYADSGTRPGGFAYGRSYEEPEPAYDLRSALTQPYMSVAQQRKRKSVLPLVLVGIIGLLVVAGLAIYFIMLNPPAQSNPSDAAAQTSPSPIVAAVATPAATDTIAALPTPTVEVATPTLAAVLLPTATPLPTVLNVQVGQNQLAALRGFNVTFSNYDNHSLNFENLGAGKPPSGVHYEGVVVVIENSYNKVLPINLREFQAVDGRNNYVPPLDGGRLPALDVPRLQPGERRAAWLTFQVSDGTTLRAVLFSPNADPDTNNTVLVNLVAPSTKAVSTSPAVAPSAAVTPTTSEAATVAPPTATPVASSSVGKRTTLNGVALTVISYNAAPNVHPFILPSGYHYEGVMVKIENVDGKDISEYLKSYPFELRDSEGYVYTVGPLTNDGPAHFDPSKFAANGKIPAATSYTGLLYFLVRDTAKNQPRTLVWYASKETSADRVEINLK